MAQTAIQLFWFHRCRRRLGNASRGIQSRLDLYLNADREATVEREGLKSQHRDEFTDLQSSESSSESGNEFLPLQVDDGPAINHPRELIRGNRTRYDWPTNWSMAASI